MLSQLKVDVWQANRDLVKHDLVTLTWGNVSGIDREQNLVVIKPSGVAYEAMEPEDMVVVDPDGNVVEGDLRPSSDTPTHVALYNAFEGIGGITHTHSTYATMFAQADQEISCLGTTHADNFSGPIPVTRQLREEEVEGEYEWNTGKVIIERFVELDPEAIPGVLVTGHAPFTWGQTPAESVKHSIVLEEVAKMALGTRLLHPQSTGIPEYILQKHYLRKHGPDAYYGQDT